MSLSVLVPSKQEPNILKTMIALEEEFPQAQIIVANDRYGKGKGWAMREALNEAVGSVVCFIDGDMDIHPRMIWRLLPFIDDYDIVVGRKVVRGMLSRRILTVLSRLYIRIFFGVKVDSQTGIKLFRRYAIPEWESDSFAFDIEILSLANKEGMTIVEVPVEAHIQKKMKLRSIWKCFLESLRIFVKLRKPYTEPSQEKPPTKTHKTSSQKT